VHYYKVRANHTIQIGATGNVQSHPIDEKAPSEYPMNEQRKICMTSSAHIRMCCMMHRPSDPWQDRGYVTRDGRPTTCMPCLLRAKYSMPSFTRTKARRECLSFLLDGTTRPVPGDKERKEKGVLLLTTYKTRNVPGRQDPHVVGL
jgi:hypothetical protein